MTTLPSSSFLNLRFRSPLVSSNLELRMRSAAVSRRNWRSICLCKLRTGRVGPFRCRSIGNNDSEEETGIKDQGKSGEDGEKSSSERNSIPTSVSSRVCKAFIVLWYQVVCNYRKLHSEFWFHVLLVCGNCNRVQVTSMYQLQWQLDSTLIDIFMVLCFLCSIANLKLIDSETVRSRKIILGSFDIMPGLSNMDFDPWPVILMQLLHCPMYRLVFINGLRSQGSYQSIPE